MNPKKVNEIMSKVVKVWLNKNSKKIIDFEKVEAVRQILIGSPHEDGFMRVQHIETGKVHLVPFEEIILNGLKGKDLEKFPVEKKI
jgi:hypothetical protein